MFLEMKRHCEEEHQNDLGMYIITHNIKLLHTKDEMAIKLSNGFQQRG